VVKQSERWAERKLAYSVKRHDRGTYVLVYFEAPPESLSQIRRDFVIDETVLRSMILAVKAIPPKRAEQKETAPRQEKAPAEGKPAPAENGQKLPPAGETPADAVKGEGAVE
jgi:small subunit ribosomal protein S6